MAAPGQSTDVLENKLQLKNLTHGHLKQTNNSHGYVSKQYNNDSSTHPPTHTHSYSIL